jgi:RNA polymerase sigma-70 factor (ECF subfamily)
MAKIMAGELAKSYNGFDRKFVEAYETLFSLIFRIAYRITGDIGRAEDVCHETFIKYYERGAPFPDMNQAKYWLIRVVKNIALNIEKRKERERRAFARLRKIAPTSVISEEEAFLKKESEKAVQEALNLLPYRLRIVLVLKEYEGLSYKDIGSIVGISEGNVKVRVYRAREKLESIFKERDRSVS